MSDWKNLQGAACNGGCVEVGVKGKSWNFNKVSPVVREQREPRGFADADESDKHKHTYFARSVEKKSARIDFSHYLVIWWPAWAPDRQENSCASTWAQEKSCPEQDFSHHVSSFPALDLGLHRFPAQDQSLVCASVHPLCSISGLLHTLHSLRQCVCECE